MTDWFCEELYPNFYKQTIKKDTQLVDTQSDFQKIEIFENSFFGRVLTLDGIMQTTEKDEYFYHEMFVHVPLIMHKNPQKILIIGGGDGGILRETLKHETVIKSTMIEIDEEVTNLCKKFMPKLSNGAFDNPKSDVRFIDGIKYVKETDDKFDVIIVDSTDPVEVAAPLFTEEFYKHCARILNKGGILVTQAGVPFYQHLELESVVQKLKPNFKNVTAFVSPVPTYVGSFMTLSFSSNDVEPKEFTLEELKNKVANLNLGDLKYYNAEVHYAAFLLPQYIKKSLLASK
ncbi:polyamine aminopropyltransferase [Rickettsiales bacterium LUAb2]